LEKLQKYNNNNNNNHIVNICQAFIDIYPLLLMKFQSENIYRGKKGSRIWCIPDSVLREMCMEYFNKDGNDKKKN